MSKESHLSINMPYTALTGEHFGPTGARFSFGLPYEQSMPEPQSKPGLQPTDPEAIGIERLREEELIQTLRDSYGEDWAKHYPITQPQPTASPGRMRVPDRSVIVDTEKVPTDVGPDAPTATPVLQETIPTSTPQEVVIPDGRIVPYKDEFIVGAVSASVLSLTVSAIVYRDKLREFKRKYIDPKIIKGKHHIKMYELSYKIERDRLLELFRGVEVRDGITEARDYMAQTPRYEYMLATWDEHELRSLNDLSYGVQDPVSTILQAMTICRALNEQEIPVTPTGILLLLQEKSDLPSGEPGEISMQRSPEGNLILRAYGEVYSGLNSQQISERLKGAHAREKEKRASAVRRALEALRVTFWE